MLLDVTGSVPLELEGVELEIFVLSSLHFVVYFVCSTPLNYSDLPHELNLITLAVFFGINKVFNRVFCDSIITPYRIEN